jgi:hypothetical protein
MIQALPETTTMTEMFGKFKRASLLRGNKIL